MARTSKTPVKTGRPSKFDPRFIDEAYKLALLGMTDEELADFWNVSVSTLHNWRAAHPKFLEATTRGKLLADAEMARSLWQRGIGYSHPAVKIFNDKDNGVTEVPYTEHYPPDTQAASLWLRNRQPAKWRDKTETATTTTIEDITPRTPLDRARRIAFLLASAQREAKQAQAIPATPEATKH